MACRWGEVLTGWPKYQERTVSEIWDLILGRKALRSAQKCYLCLRYVL